MSGRGSQLGELKEDGTRDIGWIGIDVELADLEEGLPMLRAELKRLGAPDGTELEYERDGSMQSDLL